MANHCAVFLQMYGGPGKIAAAYKDFADIERKQQDSQDRYFHLERTKQEDLEYRGIYEVYVYEESHTKTYLQVNFSVDWALDDELLRLIYDTYQLSGVYAEQEELGMGIYDARYIFEDTLVTVGIEDQISELENFLEQLEAKGEYDSDEEGPFTYKGKEYDNLMDAYDRILTSEVEDSPHYKRFNEVIEPFLK